MGRKDHLRKLIVSHSRRLEILEERQAQYGLETPAAVLTEIEDIEAKLAELQAELEALPEGSTPASITATAGPAWKTQLGFQPAAYPFHDDLTTGPVTLIGLNEIPADLVEPATPASTGGLPGTAAPEDTLTALEAERRRLAALLENNLTTPLRLLLAQSNALEQYLRSNPAAHSAVFMLTTLARQALQHVQDLVTDLHPALLETLGLEQALEMLANQKMRAHGLQITLAVDSLSERLPPRIELVLFRAAQDVLERAIHQARASHMLIRLSRQDEQITLGLIDNGIGVTDETTLQALRRHLEQVGGMVTAGSGHRGTFEIVITLNIKGMAALSGRETEVLQLLAEGRSNKEMARTLAVSPSTINFHLENIYSKLGVNSRTEAVVYALRYGLTDRSAPNLVK